MNRLHSFEHSTSPSPPPSRLQPTYAASLKSMAPLDYDRQNDGSMSRTRVQSTRVTRRTRGLHETPKDDEGEQKIVVPLMKPLTRISHFYWNRIRGNAPLGIYRFYNAMYLIATVVFIVALVLFASGEEVLLHEVPFTTISTGSFSFWICGGYAVLSTFGLLLHCLCGGIYLDYCFSVLFDALLQIALVAIVLVQLGMTYNTDYSSPLLTHFQSHHFHYLLPIAALRLMLLTLPFVLHSNFMFSFFQTFRKPWRLPLREACFGFIAVWFLAFVWAVLMYTLGMNQFPAALQKRCLTLRGEQLLSHAAHFCSTDSDCPDDMLCRAYSSTLDLRSSSYDDPLRGMLASLILFSPRSSWRFYFVGLGESLGYFQSSVFVALVLTWFHFLVPALCLAVCLWQVPKHAHSDEAMTRITRDRRGKRNLALPQPPKYRWWQILARLKGRLQKDARRSSRSKPNAVQHINMAEHKKALKRHHLLEAPTEDDTLTSLTESDEHPRSTSIGSRILRLCDIVSRVLDSTILHAVGLLVAGVFVAVEVAALTIPLFEEYKYIADIVFLFVSCVSFLLTLGRLLGKKRLVPMMWMLLDAAIIVTAIAWMIVQPKRLVNVLVMRFALKTCIVLSRVVRGKLYERVSLSLYRALQIILFTLPLTLLMFTVMGVDLLSTIDQQQHVDGDPNTFVPPFTFANYAQSFLISVTIFLGDHADTHLNAIVSSESVTTLQKVFTVLFYSSAFFAFYYILMNVLGAAMIREFLSVLTSYKDLAAEHTKAEKQFSRGVPNNRSFSTLVKRFSTRMHALPHRLRHDSSRSLRSASSDYDTPMLSVLPYSTPIDKLDSSLEVITSSHRRTPRNEITEGLSPSNTLSRHNSNGRTGSRICFLPDTEPIRRYFYGLLNSDAYSLLYCGVIFAFMATLFFERAMDADFTERAPYRALELVFDGAFFVLFSVDFVIRWLAQGMRRLLVDPLFYLDIVLQLELALAGAVFTFKVPLENSLFRGVPVFGLVRVIRILRPTRFFLSQSMCLRRYLMAVRSAVKQLAVALLFLLVVLSTFAVVGYAAFSEHGRQCSDGSLTFPCSGYHTSQYGVVTNNVEIRSPFHSIPASFLRVLELMTLSEAMELLSTTLNLSTTTNVTDASFWQSLYFLTLMVFLACFVLYLPLSIIFFHVQKSRLGGAWRVAQQQEWAYLKQWAMLQKPAPFTHVPRNILRKIPYYFTTHFFFRIFFLLFLVTCIVVLNFQFANQPEIFDYVNYGASGVIIVVLALESLLHLVGAGFKAHFSDPLRKVDVALFVLLVLSPVAYFFQNSLEGSFMLLNLACTGLVLVRVVDVCRVFRPLAALVTLLESITPPLISMVLLLVWISMSFSMLGMHAFGQVRFQRYLNWQSNLRTMPNAMRTLFYLFVWHDWKGFVQDLSLTAQDCTSLSDFNDCGSDFGAALFTVLIFIVVPLVVLNLCVSIVLDHYALHFSDMPHLKVNRSSVNAFISVWSLIDPHAEGRAPLDMLKDLNKILIQQGFHTIAFHRLDGKEKKLFRYIATELQYVNYKIPTDVVFDVAHVASDFKMVPFVEVPRNLLSRLWRRLFASKKPSEEDDDIDEYMSFHQCLMLYLYHRVPQTAYSARELRHRTRIMDEVMRQEAVILLQKWYRRMRKMRKRNKRRQRRLANVPSVSTFSQPTILSSVGHQALVMEDVSHADEELESISIAKLSVLSAGERAHVEPESTSVTVEDRPHSQLSLRSMKSHGSIRSANGEAMGASRVRVSSRMSQSSSASIAAKDEEEETLVKQEPVVTYKNPFSGRKNTKVAPEEPVVEEQKETVKTVNKGAKNAPKSKKVTPKGAKSAKTSPARNAMTKTRSSKTKASVKRTVPEKVVPEVSEEDEEDQAPHSVRESVESSEAHSSPERTVPQKHPKTVAVKKTGTKKKKAPPKGKKTTKASPQARKKTKTPAKARAVSQKIVPVPLEEELEETDQEAQEEGEEYEESVEGQTPEEDDEHDEEDEGESQEEDDEDPDDDEDEEYDEPVVPKKAKVVKTPPPTKTKNPPKAKVTDKVRAPVETKRETTSKTAAKRAAAAETKKAPPKPKKNAKTAPQTRTRTKTPPAIAIVLSEKIEPEPQEEVHEDTTQEEAKKVEEVLDESDQEEAQEEEGEYEESVEGQTSEAVDDHDEEDEGESQDDDEDPFLEEMTEAQKLEIVKSRSPAISRTKTPPAVNVRVESSKEVHAAVPVETQKPVVNSNASAKSTAADTKAVETQESSGEANAATKETQNQTTTSKTPVEQTTAAKSVAKPKKAPKVKKNAKSPPPVRTTRTKTPPANSGTVSEKIESEPQEVEHERDQVEEQTVEELEEQDEAAPANKVEIATTLSPPTTRTKTPPAVKVSVESTQEVHAAAPVETPKAVVNSNASVKSTAADTKTAETQKQATAPKSAAKTVEALPKSKNTSEPPPRARSTSTTTPSSKAPEVTKEVAQPEKVEPPPQKVEEHDEPVQPQKVEKAQTLPPPTSMVEEQDDVAPANKVEIAKTLSPPTTRTKTPPAVKVSEELSNEAHSNPKAVVNSNASVKSTAADMKTAETQKQATASKPAAKTVEAPKSKKTTKSPPRARSTSTTAPSSRAPEVVMVNAQPEIVGLPPQKVEEHDEPVQVQEVEVAPANKMEVADTPVPPASTRTKTPPAMKVSVESSEEVHAAPVETEKQVVNSNYVAIGTAETKIVEAPPIAAKNSTTPPPTRTWTKVPPQVPPPSVQESTKSTVPEKVQPEVSQKSEEPVQAPKQVIAPANTRVKSPPAGKVSVKASVKASVEAHQPASITSNTTANATIPPRPHATKTKTPPAQTPTITTTASPPPDSREQSPTAFSSSHVPLQHTYPEDPFPLRYSSALQRLSQQAFGDDKSADSRSHSSSSRASLGRLSPETAPLMSLPGTPLQHRISSNSFSDTSRRLMRSQEMDLGDEEEAEENDVPEIIAHFSNSDHDEEAASSDDSIEEEIVEAPKEESTPARDHRGRVLSFGVLERRSALESREEMPPPPPPPRRVVMHTIDVQTDPPPEDIPVSGNANVGITTPRAKTIGPFLLTNVEDIHSEDTAAESALSDSVAIQSTPSKKPAPAKGKKGGAKKKRGGAKKNGGAKKKGAGKKGGKKGGKKAGGKKAGGTKKKK